MIHKDWKIKKADNHNIASMLERPESFYQSWLKKLGFVGKETKLLETGCGGGFFAVAAARLNKEVCAIDETASYLAVAQEIKKELRIKNLELRIGKIEKLPYPDNYFDFVFSYCVWMYTDKEQSLKEMIRVLKPGGKIYLGSIADWGWHVKLFYDGFAKADRNLIRIALKAIKDGIPTPKKQTMRLLKKYNCSNIQIDPDAKLGDKAIKIKPIHQEKFFGISSIYEVLAEKM